MDERESEVMDPEAGSKPEDFKFPEETENQPTPQFSETGAPIEEFNFYQGRFQSMADRHNKRRGLDRFIDSNVLVNDKPNRPKQVSKEYVMQEQAERENSDMNRRFDQERREWDRDLRPVIESIKLKRDDPEGEGKKRRVLIFGLGGGLRGPYGAGQVIALNEMGITADKIDALAGASAGMDDLFYYADGPEQTYKGTSIYYEECTTKAFVDVARVSHIMDVSVVGNAMRKGEKAIDQEHIRQLPTEIYAVVTPIDGGDAELIDVKTAGPDMISAVEASMNVRLLRAPGTKVNDKEYEDGSFGSLPIQKLIDKFHPTDILVLPNIPFRRVAEFKRSSTLLDYIPNSGSLGTFKKFGKISGELRKMMEEFKETQGVNIGILWPPDRGLDVLDQDADMIKVGVVDTVRDTIRQFGENQPEKIVLYESEKYRK